jgi:oligopeptide transport system substrate-binding protein
LRFYWFLIVKFNSHLPYMPNKVFCSSRIFPIAALVFLLGACGKKDNRGKMIFHYNEITGIASMDPAFAKNQSIMWAVHQVYNTLVETGQQMQVIPSLATHWEINPDRTVYTFHLRRDVFFQDNEAFPGSKGRRLLAADIVFSFRRIMDKKTASSGAWIFNGRVDPDSGFLAVDDSTFRLTLIRPFNPVLGLLSMQYCSIVPHEVVEKYGKDFRSHPCGTGPFRLLGWEEGQAMVLAKNPAYFERDSLGVRLPYLDGIKISFFDSKATEFLLFRQGQLEFLNDIDPSFKDEVINKRGELKPDWTGKIILTKHPYLNTEYLGILVDSSLDLVKQSPLKWLQVRQAINYGFDRRKMMLYLRNSIGIPAESGFVPAGFPSFDPRKVKGYSYDPAKARQLLTAAGYVQGKSPVIKLLTIPVYADFASFIARELESVGIGVQVEVIQKSLLLEETAKSQALFFRASWIADYPDAENYLSVFYSKNPAPPNYTRYRNSAYDSLYEKSLEEVDPERKTALYQALDQMLIRDAPVVPLWYDEVFRLVSPRVRSFSPNSLNLLELRHTRILP